MFVVSSNTFVIWNVFSLNVKSFFVKFRCETLLWYKGKTFSWRSWWRERAARQSCRWFLRKLNVCISCILRKFRNTINNSTLQCTVFGKKINPKNSNSNCNYMLFIKLTWQGDREGIFSVFKSSCHLPTSLSHTVEASSCPFLIADRQARKLRIPILKIFGLTQSGIEPSLPFQ